MELYFLYSSLPDPESRRKSRIERVLDEGNAQYSLYLAEFYINNSQKLRIN